MPDSPQEKGKTAGGGISGQAQDAAGRESLTSYAVLRKATDKDIEAALHEQGRVALYCVMDVEVRANSADAACRAQVKASGPGVYVAAPMRSFVPTRYGLIGEPRIVVEGSESIL